MQSTNPHATNANRKFRLQILTQSATFFASMFFMQRFWLSGTHEPFTVAFACMTTYFLAWSIAGWLMGSIHDRSDLVFELKLALTTVAFFAIVAKVFAILGLVFV